MAPIDWEELMVVNLDDLSVDKGEELLEVIADVSSDFNFLTRNAYQNIDMGVHPTRYYF